MFTFEILIILGYLYESSDKVIDGGNIEIIPPVAELLKPFVVYCFNKVARWNLG
jgi:hypothetical protein